MGLSDQEAMRVATNLENMTRQGAQTGDMTDLHNHLVKGSFAVDKDSYNKVMNCWKDLNNKDRQANPSLPEVEIHNDFFGFGSTDQVVLKHSNGQKQEVYENAAHRQKEMEENAKQSQPYQMDLGRNWNKLKSSEWVGGQNDFHTDASQLWQKQGYESHPATNSIIKNYFNKNSTTVGAYDYGNSGIPTTRMSEEQLNQMLNNNQQPQSWGRSYRSGF